MHGTIKALGFEPWKGLQDLITAVCEANPGKALHCARELVKVLEPQPVPVVPEVTSQEDEAFQALPAVTADEMRGAEGMSDQMNWAFDQATHDMHVRVAAGMAAGWPQEAQPATVLSSPSTHLSAWFDASGTLHGSVSDEQLVALCRNAIAAIERHNGWFDEMTAAMAATPADSKPTNPKDAVGDTRVPLSLLSPIAKAHWALAQHCGRTKYGAWNWRQTGVRASVYISAIQRHADGYLSGETNDPEDGTHHLGNIMACCAILLEAEAAGKLQDDRPPVVGIREVYAAVEKQQAVLTAKYADRRPRHWTIGDTL